MLVVGVASDVQGLWAVMTMNESMVMGIMPSGTSVLTGLVLILTVVLSLSQTPCFQHCFSGALQPS